MLSLVSYDLPAVSLHLFNSLYLNGLPCGVRSIHTVFRIKNLNSLCLGFLLLVPWEGLAFLIVYMIQLFCMICNKVLFNPVFTILLLDFDYVKMQILVNLGDTRCIALDFTFCGFLVPQIILHFLFGNELIGKKYVPKPNRIYFRHVLVDLLILPYIVSNSRNNYPRRNLCRYCVFATIVMFPDTLMKIW